MGNVSILCEVVIFIDEGPIYRGAVAGAVRKHCNHRNLIMKTFWVAFSVFFLSMLPFHSHKCTLFSHGEI